MHSKLRRICLRRFVLWAGMITAAALPAGPQDLPANKYEGDPRLDRLNDFFEAYDAPIQHLAPHFLQAADQYELDWRLLPSICVAESSAGKTAIKNNIFGWASARRAFQTVEEGIYLVASRLAHSPLYKDKELNALLRTYNPRASYARKVKAIMRMVDRTEPLRARRPQQEQEDAVIPSFEPQRTDRLAPAL